MESGLKPGDIYELVNVMDYFNDVIKGIVPSNGIISIPMTGHTFSEVIGSSKAPVSQFPVFGAFVIRKSSETLPNLVTENRFQQKLELTPNPVTDYIKIKTINEISKIGIYSVFGLKVIETEWQEKIDVSALVPGFYILRLGNKYQKFIKI